MASYYYVRDGEQVGPVSTSRLKELAATSQIAPDDLVWQEGLPDWKPARKFAGLFPETGDAAAAPPPPPPVSPVPPVNGAPPPTPADAPPLVPPQPPGAWGESSSFSVFLRGAGRKLGMELPALIGIGAGAGCFFLLFLSTLLNWSSVSEAFNVFGQSGTDAWGNSGVSRLEGKLVLVFVALSGLLLTAGALVRQLLPSAIIVAAAVGTISTLLAVSYMHQTARGNAAARERVDYIQGSMAQYTNQIEQITGEKGWGQIFNGDVELSVRPGGGVWLALLTGLGAAAAFAVAAVFKPQPMSFLPQGTVPSFVHRYGILLAVEALAFLFAVVLWIARYDTIAEEVWTMAL